MQALSIANLHFFCVLFSLILIINLTRNAQAAKFIRNTQSFTCLDFTTPPPSSCTPVTLSSCPIDRFSKYSDSLKWDLIPVNSSMNEIIIKSNNDQLCLTISLNAVEVCPCDYEIFQRWTLSEDKILSSADAGKCLGLVNEEVNIGSCQGPISWKTYHVAPNTINLYPKPNFAEKAIQLFVNTAYNSKSLPIEIFSSSFSTEIPPGFKFIIEGKNNSIEIFDNDNAKMPPIDSISSTISVKLKPGLIIYERSAYFGASEFINVDTEIPSNSFPIGSVLVPKGSRGVIWSKLNFTGDNLGLFENVVDLTDLAASLDVDSTTCKNECGSGGNCSDDGICVCKPGFTGERCEECSSGFFGQNCQECKCTGLNKNVCDDGLTGTGECKCNQGFSGVNCSICAPGFFGNNCDECKCGNGKCNEQGTCECNAGFLLDVITKQCTECKRRYYKSGPDCKSCPPGCDLCDETGKCIQCLPELEVSPDNAGTCIPKAKAPTLSTCRPNEFFNVGTGLCEECDPACATCFGQGPGKCLQCQSPNLYLEGSCAIVAAGGKCLTNDNQSFFADTTQKICEACPSSCSDCSIPNFTELSPVENMICTKCMPKFSLDNGKCVKDCGEGKYSDENFICQACDPSCASCKGPGQNDCTKCINKNFFSLDGVCSSNQCPSGFVAVDTVCTKCHRDCMECSGTGINQCAKCPSHRPILKDGQCIEVCPMGTYPDENGTCQKCNADCSSCVGPRADQCLGCNDQNKVIIGGSCSGSCPTGSELNKYEKLCQNVDDGEIITPVETISPGETNKSGLKKIKLEWWHIFLIALVFCIVIFSLIRCNNIKKRKEKTKKFGDRSDDNTVQQNVESLQVHRIPTQPKRLHIRTSVLNQDIESSAPPPAYDIKDYEPYLKRQREQYLRNNKAVITEESSSSSSSNVGYSGNPGNTIDYY